MQSIANIVAGVLLLCACSRASEAENSTQPSTPTTPNHYVIPMEWKGSKEGDQAGNPFMQAGKPLWQLNHIWPDDWKDATNYKPLLWVRGRWGLPRKSDGEHMDRPEASVSGGTVLLGAFASHWGAPTPFSNKTAALVFIAPIDGAYSMNCVASAASWTGTGSVHLFVLKGNKADGRINKIADVELKHGSKQLANDAVQFQDVQIDLKHDDELIFVPWLDTARDGCKVELSKLSIALVH